MAEPDLSLRFARDDTSELIGHMGEMSRELRGWVNLEPEVPDDVEVPGAGLFSFMSARGPVVPLATWVPVGRARRERRVPASLGLQHPAGTRAAAQLASRGLAVPAGWRVTQDHPKRGLVVSVVAEADERTMLEWLLQAAELLSLVPPTGMWGARLYRSAA